MIHLRNMIFFLINFQAILKTDVSLKTFAKWQEIPERNHLPGK